MFSQTHSSDFNNKIYFNSPIEVLRMSKKKDPKAKTAKSPVQKGKSRIKSKLKSAGAQPEIIIDKDRGLVFSSEEQIYSHFLPKIERLEKEYQDLRTDADIDEDRFKKHEFYLTQVLQNPDEVWLSDDIIQDTPIGTFISEFEDENSSSKFHYVALTYFANEMPRFVFLHFPTQEIELLKTYQRGTKIFEKGLGGSLKEEAVDALSEGDEFAVALYQTMLKLRAPKDIPEEKFPEFLKFRETTIEEPDEVWKFIDSQGHVLVRFIKNISEEDSIYYIITTLEEETSESQYLLFSFPTNDISMVERYKQGECLEAVSYTREESH